MIIKNPYNIVVPAYLDNEFFTTALEEGLREAKINITEINFEWGSNPGDNYCSCIYRVVVLYERLSGEYNQKEQLNLIVKSIPITKETQFLEDVGVFIKEKIIYTDILPRLEILGQDFKFGANCYYTIKSPTQTIVFDDLQVDGFKLAARQDGLDWHHSLLLLQQLGKFHATSMVLARKLI
ncbi:uncharacterized protein LOC119666802 [Teleopsis dalmanni]|uniref:uncharacterized protein LOC119666802 n=1 Tax=Teleopsis dalmanni TaxID=139649 RepID=UPI0018CDE4E0|nr:uncharacterized protein LOC119666802 [Teleopsis dalmanni]